MAAVAGDTLHLHNRGVLNGVASRFIGNLCVTLQADLAGRTLDQLVLIGAMRSMAGITVTFGKRSMGRFLFLLADQRFMTGQTQLAFVGGHLQQSCNLSPMRRMTAGTLSTGKRPVLTIAPFLCLGLPVTGKTEIRFRLR